MPCTHHWIIDTPAPGEKIYQRCKKCRKKEHLPDPYGWQSIDNFGSKAVSVKRGNQRGADARRRPKL